MALDAGRVPRPPARRRHHPRDLADQPVRHRRRARPRCVATLDRQRDRRPGGHRRRRHPRGGRTGSAPSGCAVVGVPKTIDNDLSGTEVTFGFDTAVQIATEAIDRLRTTAESHHRVIVCEVMGRHAGWIATYAGIAGGAAEILVPEVPFDLDEVCDRLHPAPRRRPVLVDRGGRRGGRAGTEGPDAESAAAGHVAEVGRRLRSRPPGRDRRLAGRRDRAPHRLRVPGHHLRPRPAGRHADRLRPGAGHPLRGGGGGSACTTGPSGRWWPCRPGEIVRVPLADGGGPAQDRRPGRCSTTWPAPFLG